MGQRVSSRGSSGSHAILRNAIAESAMLRRFYSVLAASLRNGSDTRPGLPTELVIYIMRLADCVLMSMYTRTSTKSFVLHSNGSEPQSQACILTDPISKRMLSYLARMRLTTNSHDQGWCSEQNNGSWTWFDISLIESNESGRLQIKTIRTDDSDGSVDTGGASRSPSVINTTGTLRSPVNTNSLRPLSWKSHVNRQASPQFSLHEGVEFGPDHEIWRHVSEGDRILVRAFAQYPGWTNHIDWAVLRIWEWYE